MRTYIRHALPGMPKRRRWRVGLAALVAVVVAVPGIALASHQFGDVPSSSPFHADISALADAGVTGGCGGGNYCPKANVTREQMAAFMNRLGALAPGKKPVVNADKVDGLHASQLGSASGQWGAIGFDEAASTYVTGVTLTTGGAAGGMGYVMVTASATAYTDESGVCPCEFLLYVDGPSDVSPVVYFDVSDTATPTTYRNGTGSISWVFAAPNATSQTYFVAVDVAATGALPSASADTAIEGAISAVYVPFGSAGAFPPVLAPGPDSAPGRAAPSDR